jgi:dihydroorotate dehydrogenase electron transfer subunit
MPIQEKCRIQDHQKVGPSHYKLTLVSEYLAAHAQPGQFVNVKCSPGLDPLLRRPISLHRIDRQRKLIELLYEVVGKGSELLAKYSAGQELDLLGPLGNGFKRDPQKKIHILVGGGMGSAPLLGLAEELKQPGHDLYIVLGARNQELILEEPLLKVLTDQVLIATEDGSRGKKGLVSELMINLIDNRLSLSDLLITAVYACGPRPMMKAVAEIAQQKNLDCQLSLEERMACAVGACKGCATKVKDGYKMVCKDGPVFDAKEIIWN